MCMYVCMYVCVFFSGSEIVFYVHLISFLHVIKESKAIISVIV